MFRGIRRLKPGEVTEVVYGRPAPKRIRSPLPRPGPIPRDEQGVLNAGLAIEQRAGFSAKPGKWW